MDKVKILRDLRGRPLYAAKGDCRDHIRQMTFGGGLKNVLLSASLRLQAVLPFTRSVEKTRFRSAVAAIPASLRADLHSYLLYDTSWYKKTVATGMIRSGGNTFFCKFYADTEDSLFEEGQARFARDMFSGSFVIAPVLAAVPNGLFFQYIEKGRPIAEDDHIEERLLHWTRMLIDRNGIEKDIQSCVSFGLGALCAGTPYAPLAARIRSWLDTQQGTVRNIPVHGDMTPWNMFVNADEKIVLVDYERSGWHVPFYDLFHFALQPVAVGRKNVSLRSCLLKKTWYHENLMKTPLILYLIDQFQNDLSHHKQEGFNHATLMHMIDLKAAWLKEIIG